MAEDKIKIYTDGACQGNPGNGGWAAILFWKEQKKEISGFEKDTTNNRMELTAAIKALETIKNNTIPIKLYTDSMYLKNGITTWIHKWKKNDWRRSANGPEVKNIDLWQQLDKYNSIMQIEWAWVRGHSGDRYNEMVDSLAKIAVLSNK